MVVIDAYRGGNDIGYVSNGITEKNFNLDVSKYIADRLNSLGINTYITREADEDLNINQRADLIKDAFINNSNVIAISNRLNYGDSEGVEIVYSLRNSNALANKFENSFIERDIIVNKVYQRRDENDTSLDYDDLLKKLDTVQGIIINYGYINNINDSNKLKNDYIKYAEAVIKAIATHFNVPYSYTLDNEYIVKKGDSLWSIAKNNNTTVDELKKINNLSSNLLSVGQVLKIPSNNNTYIVKRGDTLWSIAKNNNITVDELKRINNLSSNLLSVGQILKISSNYENKTYIVKRGDSLWSISKNYNTTVDKLKKLNNLSSNLLSIGQKLILP